MEGKRPTLASVAAAAGVSRQTVSNVLNAPDLVLPDTRRRVLDAIEESGYRRNLAARQLRTRRSNQIGLAVRPAGDGASRQVLDEFLHRLVQEAQRLEYRVVMFAVEDDAAEIEGFASLMATSDIDGFVLTDTNDDDPRTDWLTERDVPFVAFGRPWGDDDATHAWIDVDGAAGVREATEHLIDLGYQRIAFLGWAEGGSGRDRRSGWLEALQARGVAGEPLERAVVGDSTAGATLASRAVRRGGRRRSLRLGRPRHRCPRHRPRAARPRHAARTDRAGRVRRLPGRPGARPVQRLPADPDRRAARDPLAARPALRDGWARHPRAGRALAAGPEQLAVPPRGERRRRERGRRRRRHLT